MKGMISFLMLILLLLLTTSVYNPPLKGSYTPIYMDRVQLETSVSYQSTSREMKNPGKIYYKEPYLYVNERYKGVHVINNTNPRNPVREGFIVAPGCLDMAVKGNILYLDNAVDLVAFNLDSREVTNRITDVFPEPVSPDKMYYYDQDRPKSLIIVDWKKNDNTEK